MKSSFLEKTFRSPRFFTTTIETIYNLKQSILYDAACVYVALALKAADYERGNVLQAGR